MPQPELRNIAIIAHVDHGKTTLVDQLLRQSGTFRANQQVDERVMDSLDLEREKGITIRAKNASFTWRGYKVNIVDTPGHADFGGEVERVMNMVDGVLLVVDAHEGPQAQTKFVLRKALAHGVKPLVVVNKIDREHARPKEVLDQVFEIFLELDASDAHLDFPIIYASAKNGFARLDPDGPGTDMTPLFEAIIEHVPPPATAAADHFQMLVSNLDYSDYVGRIAWGRIGSGSLARGDRIACLRREAPPVAGVATALFGYSGLQQIELERATAGDIVGVAGLAEVTIGETLADSPERAPLPFAAIDPPTITMRVVVNDGPLAGREGQFLTARHLRERLVRETLTNVSIEVRDTETAGAFEVHARGEMQIAILVEQMRREGYELLVSRPEVILKTGPGGQVLEPIETLFAEIPDFCLGDVLQALAARKADILHMDHRGKHVSIEAAIPTRGLIGLETDMVNMTRGLGIVSTLFREYAPHKGDIPTRGRGVMVSLEPGIATGYALNTIQERGRLFLAPGDQVYEGMVVGENSRPGDLPVNPCRTKHLTNMRSQGDGKGIQLEPPLRMSLERALEYIGPDEYVEATPQSLRLRKKVLDATRRKRLAAAG